MNEDDILEVLNAIVHLLSPQQAWHYRIIPKSNDVNQLELYTDGNIEKSVKEELELVFNKNIVFHKVEQPLLQKSLNFYYRTNNALGQKKNINVNESKEDFIISLVSEAKSLGSSDIHIEIYKDNCRIRFRIDGSLVERYVITQSDYPALINKIKIAANLDIAEKRLPQDGRIFFKRASEQFDIRVSALPTLYGEKIVLRLLSLDASSINIHALGFQENELSVFLEAIAKPQGIILISGPTGSGKTTTLYATLKILNKSTNNILTVEDPIEYTLPGINQVQLKESIGLSFASTLRTFLRQDPDVIMVGEIRDSETAQMAIRSSLTGHLVLSTIHTNSAWGTISRLIDMGIPSYLLANTISLTVAQRLIKLLCPLCKKSAQLDLTKLPLNMAQFINKEPKVFEAAGCDACYHTGYKGRKAIYEVIKIDNELSESIKNSDLNIKEYMEQHEINSLAQNAALVFLNGDTSFDEIYPILSSSFN